MARKPKITLHGPNSSNGPAPKRQAPLPRPSTPVQAGVRVFKTASSSQIEKRAGNASFAKQLQGVSRQKIQAVFGPKPGAKISDVRARNMSREYDSMRKAGATHAEAVRSAAEIYDVTQKDSAAAISKGHAQRAGGKTGKSSVDVSYYKDAKRDVGSRAAALEMQNNFGSSRKDIADALRQSRASTQARRDAREAKSAASATERAKAIERNATRSSASPADQIDQKMAIANASSRAFEADYAENLATQADARAKEARARGDSEGAARAEAAGKELRAKAGSLRSNEGRDPEAGYRRGQARQHLDEAKRLESEGTRMAGLDNSKGADLKFERAELAKLRAREEAAKASGSETNKELTRLERETAQLKVAAAMAELDVKNARTPMASAHERARLVTTRQQIRNNEAKIAELKKKRMNERRSRAEKRGGSGHWDDQPRVPAGNEDGGQWTKG